VAARSLAQELRKVHASEIGDDGAADQRAGRQSYRWRQAQSGPEKAPGLAVDVDTRWALRQWFRRRRHRPSLIRHCVDGGAGAGRLGQTSRVVCLVAIAIDQYTIL
jgi:hypothetical protein